MSQSLTVELNDETYHAIERRAEASGNSPSNLAAAVLERQFQDGNASTGGVGSKTGPASGSLEELFGSVSLKSAVGLDNKQIDADLAREYGDPHESS
jgi:hypothetical protein